MVEIDHSRSLDPKLRISWKDPWAMVPGTETIFVKPLPQRGRADGLDYAFVEYGLPNLLNTETGKRQFHLRRQLARNRLD